MNARTIADAIYEKRYARFSDAHSSEIAKKIISDMQAIYRNGDGNLLVIEDYNTHPTNRAKNREAGWIHHAPSEINQHHQQKDSKIKLDCNKAFFDLMRTKQLPKHVRRFVQHLEALYHQSVDEMSAVVTNLGEKFLLKRFDLHSAFEEGSALDFHLLRFLIYLPTKEKTDEKKEMAKSHCDQALLSRIYFTSHSGLKIKLGPIPEPAHLTDGEQLIFCGLKASLETGGRRVVRLNEQKTAPIIDAEGGFLSPHEHWVDIDPSIREDEYRSTAVFFGHTPREIQNLSKSEVEKFAQLVK